jgi:hypothetical protein
MRHLDGLALGADVLMIIAGAMELGLAFWIDSVTLLAMGLLLWVIAFICLPGDWERLRD